jgi:hypothetical protein
MKKKMEFIQLFLPNEMKHLINDWGFKIDKKLQRMNRAGERLQNRQKMVKSQIFRFFLSSLFAGSN